MSDNAKILFIVEGRKTERELVNRLSHVFGLSAEIYTVNGNIYALYQAVKDDPFAGITEVLAEMSNKESDKTILHNRFTDVFLVFDCDAQHTWSKCEAKSFSAHELALRNMSLVMEMTERFDESTDPQRGKLLVNYPMVESFRDCDDFFDQAYGDAIAKVDELGTYKKRVGKKKLVRKHVKDFTRSQFCDLIRMNVFKLNKIIDGRFEACDYNAFLRNSVQRLIAGKETKSVEEEGFLLVLNSLMFFPIDYFGNMDDFYDVMILSRCHDGIR